LVGHGFYTYGRFPYGASGEWVGGGDSRFLQELPIFLPIPMKLTRLVVAAYVAFVVGSLFRVPWEGWVYGPYEGLPQLKTWHVETRTGTFFRPPPGVFGMNPMEANYYAAKQAWPKMRAERLLVLWAAGGIVVLCVVWSATVGRRRQPESAASPSPAPLAQSK
jgi:hypothetical protein